MTVNLDASINLDNKNITSTLDKVASDFVVNLGNLFGGNNDGDRDEWVKTIHSHFAAAFPSRGIMVIHSGQEQISAPDKSYIQVHLEFKKTFGTEGFEVFVVRKGSGTLITNKGDGGFINWRFSGAAKRDGKTVTY